MNNMYGFENLCSSEDISHHGVLGQKWGVRKYQNPDGTLTAAGKKRYQYLNNAAKTSQNRTDNTQFGYHSSYKEYPNYFKPSTPTSGYGNYRNPFDPRDKGGRGGTHSIQTEGYYTYGSAGYLDNIARLEEELMENEDERMKNNQDPNSYDENGNLTEKAKRSNARRYRNMEAILDEMQNNYNEYRKNVERLNTGFDEGDIGEKSNSKKAKRNLIKEEFKENWSVGASTILDTGKEFVSAGKDFVSGLFSKKKKK